VERAAFCLCWLDPELSRLPAGIARGDVRAAFNAFLRPIVDSTNDVAGFYKPNAAFFEAEGALGWSALADICAYIREVSPTTPIILDAKRADIGSTNEGYIRMVDHLGVNAITVHPYLGREALEPLLARADIGVIVLVKTSNHGSAEFQDLDVAGEPLYSVIARHVAHEWNQNGNCGVVVGSTYPDELARVRGIVGDMPILMPGVGAQGGDVVASVRAGRASNGSGMIINSSRGIIYASSAIDFAEVAGKKAQDLHSAIESALLE
jgi:orotidine-5'-phosphate decarboxylase